MGERVQAAASAFTIPNVILVLWCLSSMSAGRSHRRPSFCDREQAESKREPKSFLWAIKREPPSYFFGSIHVPYTRVWDYIPENTKRAFEMAEHVFFELDLTDPYTISALTNCQLLPNGKTLSDVLPKDIYQRLKHHLEYIKLMIPTWLTDDQRGRGLYAEYLFNALTGNWERKRPVWVMLMINSLTESDIKSRGVPVLDLYLAQEADKMNKVTGAVERVEEQCVPLNGLNLSQILFALNQTLNQHESLRAGGLRLQYTTDDLIKHYNCGDLNTVIFNQDTTQIPSLVNSTLRPLDLTTAQKIDEYFREELICRRNTRMGERVDQLLLANPDKSFFFVFGAGHFIGNHTVLDVVEGLGHEVEHISIYHKVKHHRHRHKDRERKFTVPEFSLLKEFSVPNGVEQQNDATPSPDSVSSRGGSGGGKGDVRRKVKHRSRKQMSTSADGSTSNKYRNFNDLWVRLDNKPTRVPKLYSSLLLPQSKSQEDASATTVAIQKNSRDWYGLPNTSFSFNSSSSIILNMWFSTLCSALISLLARL